MEKSLAVFVWGGLGNTVMALPLINALSKSYPESTMAILLPRREFSCLIANHHGRVKIFHQGDVFLANMFRIYCCRPQIAISCLPYPRWRSGLLALSSGARMRIGDSCLANILFNVSVDTISGAEHLVERNLALLRPLGIVPPEADFSIPLSRSQNSIAEAFLRDHGLESFIGLHPGSGNPQRRWPLKNFQQLCRILSESNKPLVIFAGPGELYLADGLIKDLPNKPAVCYGTIEYLVPILARAQALIAADSGLAHCSAALGVPTLALMGPSDERMYRPYGRQVRILTNDVSCRPCHRPGQRIRCHRQQRICLDIEVDRVLSSLEEMVC